MQPSRRTFFRRVAFGMADRVVSVSRQLGDMHAQQTGFSRDRITVIHNGVDCGRFRPDPSRVIACAGNWAFRPKICAWDAWETCCRSRIT